MRPILSAIVVFAWMGSAAAMQQQGAGVRQAPGAATSVPPKPTPAIAEGNTGLAAKYPGYGWEHNCGYPTIDHRKALRALGVTPYHRQDFGTVKFLIMREHQMALELDGAELAEVSLS